MMYVLFLLTKKDALLALRNRGWTACEIFIPVILLLGTASLANKAKSLMKSQTTNENIQVMSPENAYTDPFYLPLCGQLTPVLIGSGNTRLLSGLGHKKFVSKPLESMQKEIADRVEECESWRIYFEPKEPKIGVLLNESNGTTVSYTMIVPVRNFPSDGWKQTSRINKEDAFTFTTLQNKIDFSIMKAKFNLSIGENDWSFKTLPQIQQLKTYKMALFMLPAVLGFCLLLSVINTTRNVVTEKMNVKAYLSAMGLSSWMFYCQHLISSCIKTIIIIPACLSYWVYVLKEVNPVIFILGSLMYAFAANSFSLLISTFFKTSKRAVDGTVLIWIVLLSLPYLFSCDGFLTILCSLNICHAYYYYIDAVVANILRERELTFRTFFCSDDVRYNPCFVYFAMMVFDFFWMYGAAVLMNSNKTIFDAVELFNLIKRMGQSEKLVKSRTSSRSRSTKNTSVGISSTESLSEEVFTFLKRDTILDDCEQKEEVRDQAISDIEIEQLVKVYSTGEKAVNGLTLRAIRGQVSVLLGHNGCGKSTTFSMISGINLPTDGSIEIGGVDAIEDRATARSFIGLCPQYNPIYEKLTVMEHLALVNALKGGTRKGEEQEALELLTDIGLIEKKNTLAGKLSGGMKRKLCVCMAMINNSRVILLDEPTAGMDPGARKDVQRMLEKVKKDRTILLTTHYMDEAERLGDWIFVMSHGKMAASGTSAFLKKQLGSGFLLTIVLENEGDKTEVYKLVEIVCKSYIGNAKLKNVRGQMIEFCIPDESKNQLVELLAALETIKDEQYDSDCLNSIPQKTRENIPDIKIATLGLALSSLEQVFVKIGEECRKVIADETNINQIDGKFDSYKKLVELKEEPRHERIALICMQFSGLLKKRFRYSCRNCDQYMNQLVIPIALLFLFFSMKYTHNDENKSADMSLVKFPPSIVYLRGSHDGIEKYLKGFDHLIVKKTNETNMLKFVKKHYMLEPHLGFVVEYESSKLSIHYNPEAVKAKPHLTNALANLLLIVNGKSDNKIEAKVEYLKSKKKIEKESIISSGVLVLVLTVLLAMITSPFVSFLIEERVAKYSHQQLLTGVSHVVFWGANVVYDLAFFFVVSTVLIGISAGFGVFKSDILIYVAIMFMLYFYALVPIIYTVSLLIDSPSKASTILIVYQVFMCFIGITVICFYEVFDRAKLQTASFIVYSIVPTSGFFMAVVKIAMGPAKPGDWFFLYNNLSDWNGIS